MNVREQLKKGYIVFDGGQGTQFQKMGMLPGTIPETLNVTNPNMVRRMYEGYVLAGADVITTNTFGANRKKLGSHEEVVKCVEAAAKLAREVAKDKCVALDLGPLGELIEPIGSLTFDEAYESFKEVVDIAKPFVDLVIVETMTDLYETKAAVMAVKENSDLPVFCTMTFMETMRTFTGTSVEAFALTLSPFVDAIGINCSLGPRQILPIMKELAKWTDKPLMIQANAGIPDAQMNYPVKPKEFAEYYKKYINLGVQVLGGCCGTTPDYTREIRALVDSSEFKPREVHVPCAVCSASDVVVLNQDSVEIIGERINPTGKKAMKQALLNDDFDYITNQALAQVEANATILDVNAGLPEIDEKAMLTRMVKHVQSIVTVPLQIDCGKPDAIEQALRYYNGRAIVNSVNGEDKSLNSILPIVKKYGAAVVGLTIDERGLPKSTQERVEIAEKIIKRCKEFGIREEDILIDCLTLTVSVEKDQARKTLDAIAEIKKKYSVKFVLGVSNVSFGLPNRQIVNSTFVKTALAFGLNCPIINPNIKENAEAIKSFKETKNDYDKEFFYKEFMDSVENNMNFTVEEAAPIPETERDIFYYIKRGLKGAKTACLKLLEINDPIVVINDYLIPALNEVGDEYEKGKIFLPQLIASAESAKECFAEIKTILAKQNGEETDRGTIVIGTVKGDIHDIGKNIVKTVLENYGYRLIDLGKNVEPQLFVDTAKKHKAKLVGLSALMTTTVGSMEETIKLLKEQYPECQTFVGGAVLNEDYAAKIGATYYTKDANQSVKVANLVYNH